MHKESIPYRLRRLRQQAGLSLDALAKRMGYRHASSIQRYFSDEKFTRKYLSREVAERFADALAGLGSPPIPREHVLALAGLIETTQSDLFEIQPRVPVIGAVEAKAWRKTAEWNKAEGYFVAVPIPDKYAGYYCFGFEVKGPSMNRRYPEGAVIVCIRPQDVGGEPEGNSRVVVQRRNPQGLYELTVQELRLDEQGHRWLWPDSTHPEHQAPIRFDDDENTEIVGLVIGYYRPE